MSTFGMWIAAGLTLAILSFLYKDNPLYKFAEHLYVGVSAGYWVIYVWAFDVKPMLLDEFFSQIGLEKWILLIPAIFGIMMIMRWFPKTAWMSRWPIAFTVGRQYRQNIQSYRAVCRRGLFYPVLLLLARTQRRPEGRLAHRYRLSHDRVRCIVRLYGHGAYFTAHRTAYVFAVGIRDSIKKGTGYYPTY
jgi:hypothetical protein